MSALQGIAHLQGRRDEVPNQELARKLASTRDQKGIREIAENLWNKNRNIQADCIKVLYEVGYIDPTLIAPYVGDFLKLLKSKNNRLVWGGMIALGTVAALKPEEIFAHKEEIQNAMRTGSVITVDNGVQALARAASRNAEYRKAIFPFLLRHLKTCRPKDVPQHCEKVLVAADASNKDQFVVVLRGRLPGLSGGGLRRVTKVMRAAEAL
jgi:hypothetical protein